MRELRPSDTGCPRDGSGWDPDFRGGHRPDVRRLSSTAAHTHTAIRISLTSSGDHVAADAMMMATMPWMRPGEGRHLAARCWARAALMVSAHAERFLRDKGRRVPCTLRAALNG